MTSVAKLKAAFKQNLSSQFLKNIGWLSGAEVFNRVIGLAVRVVLARLLTSYDYGLLAIIFTTIEFANVFTLRGGISSKLIQTNHEELPLLCDSAYWLNWIVCSGIFVAQCLFAFPISWFYKDTNLVLPICVISMAYLIMPFFNVQSSLIQRENRMKIISAANIIANIFGSALTLILALTGFGLWSVVIPFVVSHFSWLIVYLKCHPWRPSGKFTLSGARTIFIFAKDIVGVELLDKLRANLDYLLIGRFLGVEALGIYFFAFNAGLGISLSIIGIFWQALFPHLAVARDDLDKLKKKYLESMRVMALIAIPMVLLQTGLAPFYVPIVFGQQWVAAVPILMLICLSALPRPFGLAASQLMVVTGRGQMNLMWNVLFTLVFSIALLVAVQFGTIAVAGCVLLVHLIALPIYVIWSYRLVFSKVKQFQC